MHFLRNEYSYFHTIREDDDGEEFINKINSIFNYISIDNENSVDDIVNSSAAGDKATMISKPTTENPELHENGGKNVCYCNIFYSFLF